MRVNLEKEFVINEKSDHVHTNCNIAFLLFHKCAGIVFDPNANFIANAGTFRHTNGYSLAHTDNFNIYLHHNAHTGWVEDSHIHPGGFRNANCFCSV